MSILILYCIYRIGRLLLFEAENWYRTVLCMDAIEIVISDIIENHVESALLNIGLEDFLRDRRFRLTQT